MREWKKKGSVTLAETSIFSLHRDRVVNPRTAGELDVFTLDCPDWVNVIALTGGEELILVKQYRHGVGRVTIEIPGGMVDPGEDPMEAGVRELLEETGYKPERIHNLGFVDAQPAFQNNRCHTVLALGCREEGELKLDHGEDVSVMLMPLAEAESAMRDGIISHGLVLAAFCRYHLWKGGGQP